MLELRNVVAGFLVMPLDGLATVDGFRLVVTGGRWLAAGFGVLQPVRSGDEPGRLQPAPVSTTRQRTIVFSEFMSDTFRQLQESIT